MSPSLLACGFLLVRKLVLVDIPSYLSISDALDRGVFPDFVVANANADQIAGYFAEEANVPYAVSASVSFADAVTRKC